MKVALIVPFVLIAAAPLVGRWRANVWLRKNAPQSLAASEELESLAGQA
jgi:hypothetical protein